MDVKVVGNTCRHSSSADVESVQLGKIDVLLSGRRHTGADDRVVLFQVGSWFLTVDERDGARLVVAPARAFCQLRLAKFVPYLILFNFALVDFHVLINFLDQPSGIGSCLGR